LDLFARALGAVRRLEDLDCAPDGLVVAVVAGTGAVTTAATATTDRCYN